MKNGTVIWSSEGLHLNADTCVDVKASHEGVVLGQLGETWLHDLHMTPADARWIARNLERAADESERGA